MFKRRFLSAAAGLVGFVVLGASASAEDLVYSGVASTSDDYALGVLWSNLLVDAGSDTSLTIVENGTVAGVRKAALGEVDIVAIGAPSYLDALNGTAQFKEDPAELTEAYEAMRVILSIPTGMAQYVTPADSGVTRFQDFAGKAVGIGRPGGNAGRVSETLFAIHGLEPDAVDARRLEYGPALEEMASGSLAATLVWGGIPDPAIDNASRGEPLRFVSPDPATLEAFRSEITNGRYYTYLEVPAATLEAAYDGRVVADGPAHFWTFPFQIMVRGDIDEDTVYELTKTLWTNIDKIHAQSAALSLVSLDTALDSLSGELHPGAARYYKEIGRIE